MLVLVLSYLNHSGPDTVPPPTCVVSSQSSLGGLKVGWKRHSSSSLTQVTTHLTAKLCLNLSVPKLIQTSHFAFHPGFKCTLSFPRQHFLWQSNQSEQLMPMPMPMLPSVKSVQGGSPLIASYLIAHSPFPVVHGSHIALSFISGLPPSQGNMVILRIVDWFSKAVYLWLSPVYPWPKRRQTSLPIMFSIFIASHWKRVK